MILGLLALLAASAADAPPSGVLPEVSADPPQTISDHTLLYYNARLAIREGRATEATKLWLLRNALEAQTETVSPHDLDFRTNTWVALGELGVCQDGLQRDEEGAGLWPLATYNWVVRNRGRSSGGDRTRPFRSFDAGRQRRFIAIDDVLGTEELRTVSFERGVCVGPRLALTGAGEPVWSSFRDREVSARLLEFLLERAKVTVADDVRGRAVLDARLFDVHLQIISLERIAARREVRGLARLARELGLSRESSRVIRDDGAPFDFADDSEAARILERSVGWSVDEWMSLTPDRRIFLFDQAQAYLEDPPELHRTRLGIVDAMVADGDGKAAMDWIARHDDAEEIWAGERGARLLGLDSDAGFSERGPVALHRGVAALQRGALNDALRAFAYAVQYAPESEKAAEVGSLALRWLSYVCARFEVTDALLITLQELLPRQAYSSILEDLMWAAAFRADERSFERGLRNQLGRGALGRRLGELRPLAKGDATVFTRSIADGLEKNPAETLRFLDRMVQRLELEDGDVRALQRPVLTRLRRLLEPMADPTARNRQARRASALLERTLSMLEGLGGAGEDASARDDARRLSPDAEIFAGSIRLAPSDPIPWPFRVGDSAAPGIFTPIDLIPVESRDDTGAWIFGWAIEG